MGQLITVARKPSIREDVAIFELNRSLTGMWHELYASAAEIVRNRPVDELARRLFEVDGVQGIHVYSNMVTVDVALSAKPEGLEDIIRDLFTYYRPGVEGVHIYSNMVTVDLAAGADASGMEQIIRDLFTYYRPGVEVVEPTA